MIQVGMSYKIKLKASVWIRVGIFNETYHEGPKMDFFLVNVLETEKR